MSEVWLSEIHTLVDREVVLYWITGQYRFLAKYSVTILKRTFAFSVLADQDDKKMAVIFGLYVWGQWIVTGYQSRDQPIRSCFSCPIRGCWTTFFIAGALPGTRNSEGIVERKHKDGLQEGLREYGHHEVSWALRGRIGTLIRGTLPASNSG